MPRTTAFASSPDAPPLRRPLRSTAGASILLALAGCASPVSTDEIVANDATLRFEDFAAMAEREPWEGGVLIVDGDLPAPDKRALRTLYDAHVVRPGALTVSQRFGQDQVWSAEQARELTYCVSTTYGSRYERIVAALDAAAGSWESVAGVDFLHVASEDSRCDARNERVLFDVRPAPPGAPYRAGRAFFPGQSRASRNIFMTEFAFSDEDLLRGVLRHELGHVLGFRHEHLRVSGCEEGGAYRRLTDVDDASIMFYPRCGGSNFARVLSPLDAVGASSIYGPPGGGIPGGEPPVVSPGVPQSARVSGRVEAGAALRYQPLEVVAGSTFTVAMSGSGDADLYVRFGDAPTLATYDCRPYLSSSEERCELEVPAGATEAHVMAQGFAAARYELVVEWVAPG